MANTTARIGIVPRGTYSAATQYYMLDALNYQDVSYLVLKDVIGVTPSDDGVNYMVLARSGNIRGTYATAAALSAALPTGNGYIYAVTADQNWYYWKTGTGWIVGGSLNNNTTLANLNKQLDDIQNEFETAVGAVTVDSEVVLARGGKATLKARLDATDNDLSKKVSRNLFDYTDTDNLLPYSYTTAFGSSATAKILIIPCYGNTTYIIQKVASARFAVGSCVDYPAIGGITTKYAADNAATVLTLQTGANDNYLWVFYFHATADTLSEETILKSIQIEHGIKATDHIAHEIVGLKNESLSPEMNRIRIKSEKTQWIPFNFSHAPAPAFEIPSGATDIGTLCVMDVRDLPIDKIDNVYAWCSPHDYPGGVYLYTAPHPLGKWTNRGLMFSVADFAEGDTLSTRHVSSPDIIWDKDLLLNGEYGGFRVYFHYHGGLLDDREQRTYLAFSKDGLTLHSFYSDYTSPVIPKPTDAYAIDADYDSYARFVKKGYTWLSFFSAGHEGYGTGIGVARSDDNGYAFRTQKDYFLPPIKDEGSYAGLPSVIEYNDIIFMSYFTYTGTKGQINLAEIRSDGSIVRRGKIFEPLDTGWDNLRIAESYLFVYDDDLYLFYSGRDNRMGHVQGEWSDTQIGVTMCKRGLR
jgi:hypothetical protein